MSTMEVNRYEYRYEYVLWCYYCYYSEHSGWEPRNFVFLSKLSSALSWQWKWSDYLLTFCCFLPFYSSLEETRLKSIWKGMSPSIEMNLRITMWSHQVRMIHTFSFGVFNFSFCRYHNSPWAHWNGLWMETQYV